MRKMLIGALVALILGVPALADNHEEKNWSADGEVRARFDAFENYTDRDSDLNDRTSFFPYRALVGVEGRFSDRFTGRVDLLATGYFGDTTGGLRMYPGPSSGQVELYQGYGTFEAHNWDITAGRREHTLGNELQIGDNDFYNGLTFDGIDARGDYDNWNLDLFWYLITESNATGTAGSNDHWFSGASFGINLPVSSTIEPYILVNRQDDARAGMTPLDIYTFGFLWMRAQDGSGWDASFEVAGQTGDIGTGPTTIDAKGTIFEGWFGWTFADAHRIHVGYLMASGDDGTAGENSAWMPLFTDPHANNRLGNLDLFSGVLPFSPTGGMTNVADINLGYTFGRTGGKHAFLAALHQFNQVEQTGTSDDIGLEFDAVYTYHHAENASFQFGVATLAPGDAFGTDADNINRLWAQLHMSWGK